MSRAIRITLILAAVILVLSIGFGLLLFRQKSPQEPNVINTPTTTPGGTASNQNQNSDVTPVAEPSPVDDAQLIRTAATVFSERFESYYDNAREAVLPAVTAYLTAANAAQLERDAVRLRAEQDSAIAQTHAARVLSVSIVNRQEAGATVDVHLLITMYNGTSLTITQTNEKTLRLILRKEEDTWKITNAVF